MKRLDISRFLFYAVSIAGILGAAFAFGLYSAHKKTVVYEALRSLKSSIEESLNLASEEATTITKIHPEHFLEHARYEGSGVTVNHFADSEKELIFLSGFFEKTNQLRLIYRNGTVVKRWSVSFSKIFPNVSHLREPPQTDWNIDTHGALALPDGSVVFNFEKAGLVKLDRCGKIVWTLARETHHSVEIAEAGGFWVPGKRFLSKENKSPFPPFPTPFEEDTIMKVSEDGKVLKEISVPRLFYDNGLEAVLTATGHWFMIPPGSSEFSWDREIVHLNKIEELPSNIAKDFPLFKAGDLAISLREQNLIMVIDPNSGKIKWWQIGPWIRQHDPEFIPNGKMLVFNNNTFPILEDEISARNNKCVSNIIEYDFSTNGQRVIYGGRNGQELLTVKRGKLEPTQNGGILVTESESGRVFEIDAEGHIIWEYINRYDSDEVAEITEARIYPADYFHVSDWSCK